MPDKIRMRRGNIANLPTLDDGEIGLAEDTKKIYIGTTTGNQGIVSSAPTTATWIAPTLLNSWVNYGTGQVAAGYYKDDLGIVRIKGQIKSGTATSGTTLFTLPAGYRPAETMVFPTASNSTYGQVYIRNTGDVVFDAGSNVFFVLSVLAFRAEL